MNKHVIICVDDEKIILDTLKEQLKSEFADSIQIETAESGEEALELIKELNNEKVEIPLVIADQLMPRLKGDELLIKIHQIIPKTLKILLTGQATTDDLGHIINNLNLYRYITKPWEENDLILTVKEAIKSYIQDKLLANIQSISQKVRAILNFNELITYLLSNIVELSKAHGGLVYIHDDETDELSLQAAKGDNFFLKKEFWTEIANEVYRTGEKIEENVSKAKVDKHVVARDFSTLCILVFPVRNKNKIIGICCLEGIESRYNVDYLSLFETFITEATTAIENSMLFEKNKETTEVLLEDKDNLEKLVNKLRDMLGSIIEAISVMLEKKDPYTAGHQQRVSDLARAIATEMGLTKDQIDGIRIAGIIHDIGKIGTPIEILSKPGELDYNEFELIKKHVLVSCDILHSIDFPWPIEKIVKQHHERLDGSGYPSGLKGDEICIEARIIAVADVVEAMASHRPYREALGEEEALKEIVTNKGIKFDERVVETCLKLFNEKRFEFKWNRKRIINP
jgi:putative nucleotidyltransferase with HDIG domain